MYVGGDWKESHKKMLSQVVSAVGMVHWLSNTSLLVPTAVR